MSLVGRGRKRLHLETMRDAINYGAKAGKLAKQYYDTYQKIKKSKPRKRIKFEIGPSTTNKATMKKSGSKKIKSIQGKSKRVRVSNSLRKKIKKVIEEKKAPGYYVKSTNGTIGSVIRSSTGSTIDSKINGVTNQIAVIPMYSDVAGLGGQQICWWQAMFAYNDTSVIPNGWDMCYFTPAKFLDAASILWNKKSMDQDATVTTGNFTTETTAPGVPAGQYRSNIHVKNSYVTFEFKNNGQRTMYLLIRHCVPKVKFCEKSPLQAFQAGVYNDGTTYLDNGPLVPQPGSSSESFAKYMNDPDLPWNFVDNFSKNWKYETVKISIAAGETCKHSIQGPKNMTINYNDLIKDGSYNLFTFYKKTSCAVVIGVYPDLVYANTTGTRASYSGRWVDFANKDDLNVRNPISMEVKEHFDLGMPEITGFMSQPDYAGVQPLSLRAKKYASYKYGDNIDEAAAVINRYDEEQPGTIINLG